MDHGSQIAYTVLAEGTPVISADGGTIGSVKRVLADEASDIFDGIVIDTHQGERFVDAPEIDALYERAVVLSIPSAQASELPRHQAAPAVIEVDADTIAGDGPGDKSRSFVKRAWDRISGNY
jgi:hypothetical protein